MRVYLEIARLSFRRYSTYRGAAFAGVFTNTVFGFVLASILRAAVGDRTVGGLDRDDVTLFTFAAQGMLAVVNAFGDFELANRVLSGEVATELHRPVDFASFKLANDVGRSGFNALARGIPPFVIGWIAFRFELPGPSRVASFLMAIAVAVVLSSRLWTIVGLVSFWLTDGNGVVQMMVLVVSTFGGVLIPLQFFPDSMVRVLEVLPFAALVQLPVDVYLGFRNVGAVLVVQSGWVVTLELVLRWELRLALRKLEIQGG